MLNINVNLNNKILFILFRPQRNNKNSLLQAVDTAVAMNQNGDYGIPVPDYVEENVSTKVVKIIQSYIGVVNKITSRNLNE